MSEALHLLRDIARKEGGFVELRYHAKTSRIVGVDKG
jgi:hypothetical protein